MNNREKAKQLSEVGVFGAVTVRQVSKASNGRGKLLGDINLLKAGTEEEQKVAQTAFAILGDNT